MVVWWFYYYTRSNNFLSKEEEDKCVKPTVTIDTLLEYLIMVYPLVRIMVLIFGWQDRETLDNFFPIESLIAHRIYSNDTYRYHQQGLLNPNRMTEWTGEHSFNTYLNKLRQYDDYQYLWDVYAMAFLNGVTESNTLMSDEALNWVKANLGGKTTSDFGINSSSSGGVSGQHIPLLEQTGAYLYAIGRTPNRRFFGRFLSPLCRIIFHL